MAKVQILMALLIPLLFCLCPATLLDSSLTTTNLNLISLGTTSTYTYSFQNSYPQPPQVTFSVTELQLPLASKDNFALFWCTPIVSISNLKLISNATKSSWQVSRLTVIISSNRQLLLDLVYTEIQSSLGTIRPQFKLNSNNVFSNSTPLIIRTFIAGLNATSNPSFLLLGSSSLQNNTLSLQLQATAQSSFFLMVSLAVFPQQSSSFVAYGSTATIGASNTKITDLFQSLIAAQYIFYGINGVKFNTHTQSTFFSAEIGADFILNMMAKGQGEFQLSYFFLGNSAKQICASCQINGLGSIYYQGFCIQSCPMLTVEATVDNWKLCRSCPSALNLGFSAGQCIKCDESSLALGGQCLPKSSQQPYYNYSNAGTINLSNLQIFQPAILLDPKVLTPQKANQSSPIISMSNPQCPLPNMFWNGGQCTCAVGYTLIANICSKIFIPTNVVTLCSGQNQYFDGHSCNCLPSYFYLNGICTNCPVNSVFNGQFCACNSGYILSNFSCVPIKNICPPNSNDNGKGQCLCNQKNYTIVKNSCQPISCGVLKIWNGSACICQSGYTLTSSGTCYSQCSVGQQWSSASQNCLSICGPNTQYDSQQQKCVCIEGFAIGIQNQCQQCLNPYFSLNGYCVTCPNYYSVINGNCVCQVGYRLTPYGSCQPKCSSLETFNPTTSLCECLAGLVRSNGTCTMCPANTYLQGETCLSCGANAQMIGGKCICAQGYIADAYGAICFSCQSQKNSYLLNGYCIRCPYGQVYNNFTLKCSCPPGTVLSSNACVSACRADEALDSAGNCFGCGANMVLSGSQCVCAKGYIPMQGCGCQLSCTNSQFQYRGVCAQCPPNMIYMAAIQGCICPTGYYLSSIFNTCLQTPFIISQCKLGQYLDNSTNKCVGCQSTCSSCNLAGCLTCKAGYQLINASICQSICGDGLIVGYQDCDTGLMPQPGCQLCNVVAGYTCSGQPSVCKPNNSTPTPTPTPTQNGSLQLQLAPQINTNNIFVSLATTPTFTFNDSAVMKSFIQLSFASNIKPTVYCVQGPAPNLNLFNCLFVYPNGVPNNIFNVTFAYNYQGYSAKLTIQINPLASQNTLSNRSSA